MAGMQALPRVFLALSEAGNAGAQCDTTQSKALFSRLSGQLQAGSQPDTSLVVKALLVARAVGWPSPVLLRSLVARLASTASTLCRRLQAAGQADAATRLDDEGRLASALCMLCHTLQAAAVVTLGLCSDCSLSLLAQVSREAWCAGAHPSTPQGQAGSLSGAGSTAVASPRTGDLVRCSHAAAGLRHVQPGLKAGEREGALPMPKPIHFVCTLSAKCACTMLSLGCWQLIRVTAMELLMTCRGGHADAACVRRKLAGLLARPFTAAKPGHAEETAAGHMTLLLAACHGEHWQTGSRMLCEVMLHVHAKVRLTCRTCLQ